MHDLVMVKGPFACKTHVDGLIFLHSLRWCQMLVRLVASPLSGSPSWGRLGWRGRHTLMLAGSVCARRNKLTPAWGQPGYTPPPGSPLLGGQRDWMPQVLLCIVPRMFVGTLAARIWNMWRMDRKYATNKGLFPGRSQ